MIHSAKTLNWPYTSCLLSQLYQNWKCCIKMQKSLFGVDSFFYGHHLPVSRKHQLEFQLGLLPWKPWKEIKLSSSTSFAKLDTNERRRSLTSFFLNIVWLKKAEMDDKVQKFGGWSARQTGQDGGMGEKGVIGWLRPVWYSWQNVSYLRTKRSDQN